MNTPSTTFSDTHASISRALRASPAATKGTYKATSRQAGRHGVFPPSPTHDLETSNGERALELEQRMVAMDIRARR